MPTGGNAPIILSEASVSAVMRFTWRNPVSGRRERGVFKVSKPHIPGYFAEEWISPETGAVLWRAPPQYGFPSDLIPDTFRKVRRLLQHEVNFVASRRHWWRQRIFIDRCLECVCRS